MKGRGTRQQQRSSLKGGGGPSLVGSRSCAGECLRSAGDSSRSESAMHARRCTRAGTRTPPGAARTPLPCAPCRPRGAARSSRHRRLVARSDARAEEQQRERHGLRAIPFSCLNRHRSAAPAPSPCHPFCQHSLRQPPRSSHEGGRTEGTSGGAQGSITGKGSINGFEGEAEKGGIHGGKPAPNAAATKAPRPDPTHCPPTPLLLLPPSQDRTIEVSAPHSNSILALASSLCSRACLTDMKDLRQVSHSHSLGRVSGPLKRPRQLQQASGWQNAHMRMHNCNALTPEPAFLVRIGDPPPLVWESRKTVSFRHPSVEWQ
eukprot:3073152-Rhodomonas_salina.3